MRVEKFKNFLECSSSPRACPRSSSARCRCLALPSRRCRESPAATISWLINYRISGAFKLIYHVSSNAGSRDRIPLLAPNGSDISPSWIPVGNPIERRNGWVVRVTVCQLDFRPVSSFPGLLISIVLNGLMGCKTLFHLSKGRNTVLYRNSVAQEAVRPSVLLTSTSSDVDGGPGIHPHQGY